MVRSKIGRYETIYLCVVFTLFLFVGVGSLIDYKIMHDFPDGLYAMDAYFHESFNEYIYEDGNYKSTPSFATGNVEGMIPMQPPLLYYLVPYIAHTSGLPVYDVTVIFLGILMVLSCYVFYLIIRRLNKIIALLSLPLMFFLFKLPFIAVLTFGQHIFILGMFFFILSIYFLLQRRYILLTLSTAGIVLAHTAEIVYFIPILLGIFVIRIFQKKNVKGIVLSFLFGLLLSFNFLIIFFITWVKGADKLLIKQVSSTNMFNFATIYFDHLYIQKLFVVVGFVFLLIHLIKTRKNIEEIYVFLVLFVISFGTFFNISRIYQYRFFIPVFLSVFSGATFYYVLRPFISWIVKQKKSTAERNELLIYILISLIMLIVIFNIFYIQFYFSGKPLPMVNKDMWESMGYLDNIADKNSSILFADMSLTQYQILWKIKKTTSHLIDSGDFTFHLKNRTVSDIVLVKPICDHVKYTRYGLFDFRLNEEKQKNCEVQNRSICSYDYFFIKIYDPQEYDLFWLTYLENTSFVEEYRINNITIMRNENISEEC